MLKEADLFTVAMAAASVIQPDQAYTFADYFKLNYDTEDALAYFGYSFQPQAVPTSAPRWRRRTAS